MPITRRGPLLLPVALVLLFAACSDREDLPPRPNAATQAASATSTSTPSATPGSIESFPAPEIEKTLGTRTDTRFIIADPAFEPLPGARALSGALGDAAFRIEVPDDWNGSLVLYAHGVRLATNQLTVANPGGPLREAFIEAGYAWAASSYSENMYVPGIGADDTVALLRHFEAAVGDAERVYLVGESMGGNVVALLLEHYPGEWDGAMALCGAVGGEEQLDYLLSWTAAAEYTSGVALPIGEPAGDMNGVATALLRALGPPQAPTPQGARFAGIIRELTGGPRPFFSEGLAQQFQLNFALLQLDPEREMLPTAAASNLDTVYRISAGLGLSDDDVNAGIRRIGPVGDARDATLHPDAVPTTGNIDTPLLTLHNTGDLFVPISQEVDYRRKVESHGKGDLLVQRAIRAPGHCDFSDEEVLTAWDDLVAWVEDDVQPAGDDLSGDLTDIGRSFTNPPRAGDPGNP